MILLINLGSVAAVFAATYLASRGITTLTNLSLMHPEDLASAIIVTCLFGVIVAGIGLVGGGIIWYTASNEAAAFNRFTDGPKATTWDAVWLELRVEACRQ